MRIAVYPGTFDPVHNGHIDIARRAAEIFDKLIVGVYDRPIKNLLFTVQERLSLLQDALDDLPNVQVVVYGGMTVDFVRRMQSRVIVRGLRVISDFELEYQMALTTRRLAPDVDMVCLMTGLEHAFISSTIVKDIAVAGGSIGQFVPPHVERAVRNKLQAR